MMNVDVILIGTELLGETWELPLSRICALLNILPIANITRKAHRRANLIHRCFIYQNTDLLVRAFKTYVRPMLEHNSPV